MFTAHRRTISLRAAASALVASSLMAVAAPQALAQRTPAAASPAPMSRATLWPHYTHESPLIASAQAQGLSPQVLRALDEPETPYGLRAALIEAVVFSRKTPKPAKLYADYLARTHGAKRLELHRLATHEAFTLGWMRALEDPDALSPIGGDSEAHRGEPLTLLTVASNRLRGDMAIQLIHALVKAQLAHVSPSRALCEPHRCVEAVVENYTTHWSVAPEAVCSIVDAVTWAKRSPKRAAALCARVRAKASDAPLYQASPDAPETLNAGLVSRPVTPSQPYPQLPPAMLQGLGLPPNLPLHDPVAMQRVMQQLMLQQLRAVQYGGSSPRHPLASPFGQLDPRANPQTITIAPQGVTSDGAIELEIIQEVEASSQGRIQVEIGEDGPAHPTSNEELHLVPDQAQD